MSLVGFGGGLLWGQLSGPSPDALAFLALRRWFEGVTLASAQASPSRLGLWIWLGGLGVLLLMSVVAQGPRKALGQFLDPRGHVRVVGLGLRRSRRAGRMVAVIVGGFVLSWTTTQFAHYSESRRLAELSVLMEGRTAAGIAVDHGILAGLVPLRDVCSLGDCLILVLPATVLVFRLSANRWGGGGDPYEELMKPLPWWTTACWGASWLYGLYRFAMIVTGFSSYPMNGCVMFEGILVPVLMVAADGLLLAWLLVELRDAGHVTDESALNVRGVVALWPVAMVGCVAALPGRYIATAGWLFLPYTPTETARRILGPLLSGGALAWIQGGALVTVGLVGVAAWTGGRPREMWGGYWRLIRERGGLLTAIVALSGGVAGLFAGAAYVAVLSMPHQPWLLTAADAYAHYGTLAVGLVLTACLVELGLESLPRASLAGGVSGSALETEVGEGSGEAKTTEIAG